MHLNLFVRARRPYRWLRVAQWLLQRDKVHVGCGENIRTWPEGDVYIQGSLQGMRAQHISESSGPPSTAASVTFAHQVSQPLLDFLDSVVRGRLRL